MKIKIFTPDNAPHMPKKPVYGKAVVSFTPAGSFRLTRKACILLGATIGDKIVVIQDEQYMTDFYIAKRKEGFELTELGRGLVGFKSSTLAGIMGAAIVGPGAFDSVRLSCTLNKDGWLQLDTKHPETRLPRTYNRKNAK